MATVKHHKVVAALPAELEPDAIYYVRAGQGHDVYVTNGSGMIVGYPANAALGLAGKVDKAEGQSLMTDAERAKLGGIEAGATANATDAQLRDRSTHTGTQAISTVTGLQTALDEKIDTTERGVSGGVATLDEFARIPASQLPSYVDDVLEFPTRDDFPATGEGGKIYIAVNQGTQANPTRQYRWAGSVYAEINPSPGTTDALAEGSTNQYFSEHRVRNTLLTGLSLAVSTAVTAADTVLSALGKLQAQLGLKAPLDSPAFTGNPTAPTPAATDNDTSLATTAFVRAAMGLFGLGVLRVNFTADVDANTLVTTGLFYVQGTNLPGGDAGSWFLRVDGADNTSGRVTQEAERANSTVEQGVRIYRRRAIGGSWTPWQEIWHTGNLVKQTSPTDTTAGAMMAVGAFGLGATVSSAVNDANTAVTGGKYVLPSAAANKPDAVNAGWTLDVTAYTSSFTRQVASRPTTTGLLVYERWQNGADNWLPWQELFHTGNFDPAAKQDKSSVIGTATTRTLALTDAWNYVRPGTTSAITLTVPTNASVAFEIGTEITIRALGNVTLAAASGVTLYAPSGGTLSMTANMTVTLKKVGANLWDVIGQTVAA
ncbi:pyocin knob domain-containing protein [Stutzerimonas nitrititolerans]|uniref:pyocin knob domain-containing protein n=1 Tax=Stutzerimonas nitrititolerans TaxID=2482751 RepID=UPI00289A18E9|nr:pyocin knob domain-containing protein [Stutzerimonas nitrititolerans]